jgi:hypothetical protein
MAPDLALPYPYIDFPTTQETDSRLVARYEEGFGDWPNKLARFLVKGRSLRRITIEYGGKDDYQWIGRGAVYVSALMRARGIANDLVVSEGGHESALGKRLETGLFPAVSRALEQTP